MKIKITRICKEWNAKIPKPEVNTGGLAVECSASDPYIKLAKELKIDGFTNVAQGVAQDVAQGVAQDVAQEKSIENTILEYIKANNKISREEIARKTGKSIKTIERYLSKMKSKVIFVGSGYSGYWKILDGDSDE